MESLLDGHDPTAPRPVLGEAHGGYTFCALGSWILLQPYIRTHYKSPSAVAPVIDRAPPTINLRSLLRWLTHMQGTGIELGGFKGRTNKLVDGCYSWWVGGCFPLVDALLGEGAPTTHDTVTPVENTQASTEDNEWHDIDGGYILRAVRDPFIVYDDRTLRCTQARRGWNELIRDAQTHYSIAKRCRNTSCSPGSILPAD